VSTRIIVDGMVYLLVRVVVCVVQTMRIESCHALARGLAVLANDVVRLRRKVVDENLQGVFPNMSASERRRLTRRMWEHLFLMGCEIVHAPRTIHRTNWYRYVSIDDKRVFLRYLLDPRPTMIVSGHFGNFELGGYITGLLGFPTFAVARTLDNRFLDRFVTRFREANGQYIIDKDGSAIQIDRLLASGDTLSLLADQHAGPKGVWVDFFGRPASCHKAIALFTLTSHAPMLVSYARREARPLRISVGLAGVADPLTMGDELCGVMPLTQWYNDRLEEIVRQTPDQYWWLHRRWKGQPPRHAAARKAAA